MRASIYNAMPIEGINELIAFMKEFEVSMAKEIDKLKKLRDKIDLMMISCSI